jgi:NAD(P)-dependent dehydrogenase (short-subunit alcohol dehydrogenase family)
MGRLDGRRAVVTGAAQGIGLACARSFLAEGARVVLADINAEGGQKAVDALVAEGRPAVFVACDVARRDQLEAAVGRCVEEWGGIDILLNNAGIAPSADLLTIDDALLDRVLGINLRAPVIGTQVAARRMIEQGTGGVIINMSSVNAVLNIPHLLAYNIAKGGLNQLTRNSAITLAPHGIRVCGIGPGTVLTELSRAAVLTNEEAYRTIMSRTPIGRAAEPEEIAAIAVFLASDDASYVTGETIYADGGRLGLNYTVKPGT